MKFLFTSYRELIKQPQEYAGWTTDDIWVALLRDGYTPDKANEFLWQLPADSILATKPLSNRRIVQGAADADDIVFEWMPKGETIEAIVIYYNSDKRLISYNDESKWNRLPLGCNGCDVSISWDNGKNKIFSMPRGC